MEESRQEGRKDKPTQERYKGLKQDKMQPRSYPACPYDRCVRPRRTWRTSGWGMPIQQRDFDRV